MTEYDFAPERGAPYLLPLDDTDASQGIVAQYLAATESQEHRPSTDESEENHA